MSLLEDIFLGDEANEAQELERVIDGDEYDDRPRSRSRSRSNSDENSEKEDEAEEDKRRVDPTNQKAKKVVKNPRFTLNPARLTGPRGIQILPEHFKDFKFKGKGYEKEDLDVVLKKLEHWAYRLYPKFQFEDCLKKIETLGKKQPVKVHLHRIRTDQLLSHETVVQKDSSDDEQPEALQEEDEFDKLLQQQIELARSTPAPGSAKKGFMTPAEKIFAAPRATSSPSINDEQRERMIRNRQLAEERRLAKLKQTTGTIDLSDSQQLENKSVRENEVIDITETGFTKPTTNIENIIVDLTAAPTEHTVNSIPSTEDVIVDTEVLKPRMVNRSNVIDSSDEECDIMAVNQSVSVDIHNTVGVREDSSNKSINDVDTANAESNINTDVSDDDGMETCAETTSCKDNSVANTAEINSVTTDVSNVNADNITNMNADDLSSTNTATTNLRTEDKDTAHTSHIRKTPVDDIDDANTEIIGSMDTEVLNSTNTEVITSEAIEVTSNINTEDTCVVNTKDSILDNEVTGPQTNGNDTVNTTNNGDKEINEIDVNIPKLSDNTIQKNIEQDLISSENEKSKNIDLKINKENVDTNIVLEQGINEELMDVDFSDEF